MTPNEIKSLLDYLITLGPPGVIGAVLTLAFVFTRGKQKDPASEVASTLTAIKAELDKANAGIAIIDRAVARIETRQTYGKVQHHTDRTMPPR